MISQVVAPVPDKAGLFWTGPVFIDVAKDSSEDTVQVANREFPLEAGRPPWLRINYRYR